MSATVKDAITFTGSNDYESAEGQPAIGRALTVNSPRLCAHADRDCRGMHVLQPGERCPHAP